MHLPPQCPPASMPPSSLIGNLSMSMQLYCGIRKPQVIKIYIIVYKPHINLRPFSSVLTFCGNVGRHYGRRRKLLGGGVCGWGDVSIEVVLVVSRRRHHLPYDDRRVHPSGGHKHLVLQRPSHVGHMTAVAGVPTVLFQLALKWIITCKPYLGRLWSRVL